MYTLNKKIYQVKKNPYFSIYENPSSPPLPKLIVTAVVDVLVLLYPNPQEAFDLITSTLQTLESFIWVRCLIMIVWLV